MFIGGGSAGTAGGLKVGAVATGTAGLLIATDADLDDVLLEVISAFATVGMSTGLTPTLGVGGQLILVGLMFFGRLGPITLGVALALRERPRRYEVPEERVLVG